MGRLAAAVLLSVMLSGCTRDTAVTVDDEGRTTVADGTHVDGTAPGAVTIPVGEKLLVDFGSINNSVGDDWFLVGPADPAVLADEGDHYDSECDDPGCGARMWWRFAGVAPGTTGVTFQYCYRSRPPACEPMAGRGPADPVTVTITVG